jgi:O-antigen/teichoic acid export membrane protein
MHSSLRRLGSEFFWVALGQGMAAVGGVVGVRLLTGFMNPVSYGELALALTIVLLSQQVVGPICQPFMRFFAPMQEANKLTTFFRAALGLSMQATGVVLVFTVLAIIGLWAIGEVRWVGIVVLAFLLSLLTMYNSGLDGVQNAARHRTVVAWHQGIGQWVRVAMAILLIVILGSSSAVVLLGYTLGAALVLTSQLVFLKKRLLKGIPQAGGDNDVGDCVRRMRGYAWPFAGWGMFTWAQLASDRWALQMFAPAGVVGMYAALYQIGYYPILLLMGLATQLIEPILFSWAGDGSDTGRLNRAHRLNRVLLVGSLALTMVGTIVAFLFHDQIFWLVVAPKFRGVAGFLPLMVLASGLFASGQIASFIFHITGKTQCLLAPKIGTCVLCVLLNFLGAYRFGLAGVVFSSVIFSVAYLIWVSVRARGHVRREARSRSENAPWALVEIRRNAT